MWDAWGAGHGDMTDWEYELFRKGVGCPGCKGKPTVEFQPTSIEHVEFGDEDPALRIEAFERRDAGEFANIKWEPPPKPAPVRGNVYEAADADEIKILIASSEDLEECGSFSYGDLHELRDRDQFDEDMVHEVVVPKYLVGSDYSGSTVEMSNHRSFLKSFKDVDGVYNCYGGYGTFAVIILASVDNDEIASAVRALHEYPLLNEEDHSELEIDLQNEQWGEAYGTRHEFIEALEKRFNLEELELEVPEGQTDNMYELFENARERANEYWEAETGGTMYIRVEKVAAVVEWQELVDTGATYTVKPGDDE